MPDKSTFETVMTLIGIGVSILIVWDLRRQKP